MDKGKGQEYSGKSLKEININPEVDCAESDESESEEPMELDLPTTLNFEQPVKSKSSAGKRKYI